MTGALRPSHANVLTKLCQDGLDIARHLRQCPEDQGERARLKKILGEIQRDPAIRMRRKVRKKMSAEILAEGFERMTRLCDIAKSRML